MYMRTKRGHLGKPPGLIESKLPTLFFLLQRECADSQPKWGGGEIGRLPSSPQLENNTSGVNSREEGSGGGGGRGTTVEKVGERRTFTTVSNRQCMRSSQFCSTGTLVLDLDLPCLWGTLLPYKLANSSSARREDVLPAPRAYDDVLLAWPLFAPLTRLPSVPP